MGERRFYPELESLRGIAAMMVALFHVLQARLIVDGTHTLIINEGWVGLRILGNGLGGVVFFFVLSGFVLSHQLSKMHGDLSGQCWRFIVGRLFRIYPAVWTTLALLVTIYLLTGYGLSYVPSDYEPKGLLEHFLLFRTSINGVMWTLKLELLAVPVIFALFLASQRFGVVVLFAAFAVLVGLSFTGHWTKLLSDFPLLQPMYAFVAGMLAWRTSYLYKGRSGWWLALAAVGFLATRPLISWGSNWSMLLESVFAAVAIAMLVANPSLGTNSGLTTSVLRYYGRISYSFYLLHPVTLIVVWYIIDITALVSFGLPPTLVGIGLFVATVIAATPLAHLQYALVERVGIKIGRALTRPADSPREIRTSPHS